MMIYVPSWNVRETAPRKPRGFPFQGASWEAHKPLTHNLRSCSYPQRLACKLVCHPFGFETEEWFQINKEYINVYHILDSFPDPFKEAVRKQKGGWGEYAWIFPQKVWSKLDNGALPRPWPFAWCKSNGPSRSDHALDAPENDAQFYVGSLMLPSGSVHLPGSAKLQAVPWAWFHWCSHGAQEQLLKSFGFTVRRLSDLKLGSQLQTVDGSICTAYGGERTDHLKT